MGLFDGYFDPEQFGEGDHYAMIATINPDIGKVLIAQAMANQRRQDEPRKSSAEHRCGCSCGEDQSDKAGCGCT
jgi:hypothetical protein